MNAPIVLATINARYIHAALGLRYLKANLGRWCERAVIREFLLTQSPTQIVEALLNENPRIIAFSVYVWNVTSLTEIVRTIKRLRPEIAIIIGGPEVSHEYESTDIFRHADLLIRGEADAVLEGVVGNFLAGDTLPRERVLTPPPPDLAKLKSPYIFYSDEDLAHRLTYVETSRGCPFGCEFCLSSLDPGVRYFPLEPFLAEMTTLIDRGARRFKFVDRTFNLNLSRVLAVLEFFRKNWRDGMDIHFEFIPDRLAEELKQALRAMPPGGVHLEIGIQSFDPAVLDCISRRQETEAALANLEWLCRDSGARIHADLIVGLPGESTEAIAAGFNRLVALNPEEIQVGILKRLKGAPIARHAEAHRLIFSDTPPYEILQTDLIDFMTMQKLKRLARIVDLFYNSANFPDLLKLLWRLGAAPFDILVDLSERLWLRTGRTHELGLTRLARELYAFLVERGVDSPTAAETVEHDYRRLPGRRERLTLLDDR